MKNQWKWLLENQKSTLHFYPEDYVCSDWIPRTDWAHQVSTHIIIMESVMADLIKFYLKYKHLAAITKTNNNKIKFNEMFYYCLTIKSWWEHRVSYRLTHIKSSPILTVNFVARIKIYMCKKLVVIWWVYVRCSNKWNYCSQLNYINAQLNLTHFFTMALNARLYTQKRKNVYYTQNR